jgi:hypothetical protein
MRVHKPESERSAGRPWDRSAEGSVLPPLTTPGFNCQSTSNFITAHSWLTHGYPLAVACPHPAITFYVGNIATCGISWFFASQLVHETTLKAQKPQPSLADHPSPNASSYKRFQTLTTLSIDLAQTSSPTFSLGPLLLDCPHGVHVSSSKPSQLR